jgi:hypothetical protein
MDSSSEEMKKWVEALSVAEKRFIKLLGKARAGNAESQQLAYMDWLNRAQATDDVPARAKFSHNLHTVSNRLKDLILDGLRLLNKEANIDARLRTTLDEIAVLREKKLYPALARQLKRTKRVALAGSRYGFALQCIQIEQEMNCAAGGNGLLAALEALREEEMRILRKQHELLELQYRHARMQVNAAQILVPRNAAAWEDLQGIADGEWMERNAREGNYLEKALAVNILGFVNWMEGKPLAALERYEGLLKEWARHPEWQNDQGPLLFFICHCFQAICFHSPLGVAEAERYLALIPDFRGLPPDVARDFQRMLYHHRFTFAMNLGQLERLPGLIAEIDAWVAGQGTALTAARVLPFLHNMMVAEFILGEFRTAHRRVQEILVLPHRNIRQDIREFALVMQAILQYELGEDSGGFALNEYTVRAGKRHFKQRAREVAFELAVFRFLERVAGKADGQAMQGELRRLSAELEELAGRLPEATPSLGLMEVMLWTRAKVTGKALREVFLEAVRANLEGLGE